MRWFQVMMKAIDFITRLGGIFTVMEAVDAHTSPASAYEPAAQVLLAAPDVQMYLGSLGDEDRADLEKALPYALKMIDIFVERRT